VSNFQFSVLLPVYHGNTTHEFTTALNSILSQSVAATEIVIVQDGPVDDGIATQLAELKKQAQIKVITFPINTGVGNALNEGLKHCTYEWIARMDADDMALPNRFEETIKHIEQHPELDLVGAYYAERPEKGDAYVRKVPLTFAEIKKFSKYRTPHSHPTVFYKKTPIQKVGGYRNFHFAEDWYLWLRLYKAGHTAANIPKMLVYAQSQDYNRRLGFAALKNDYKAISKMYKEGLMGLNHFLINIFVRLVVRLLPVSLANTFYKNYLRSATKN
jgi:glycosyltransferase involved in cell wall biosynthesis